MNLTESLRSRSLIEAMILAEGTSAHQQPDWKVCAARIAILAFGYGAFFMLKKRFCPITRNLLVSAQSWSFPGNRDTTDETSMSLHWSSEGEVCPICLEPPRSGVRAGCGHRLCAHCLRRYCEAHLGKRHLPPPCPICRTPLVSVTLTYDQINLPSLAGGGGSDTADSEIVRWLNEYNKHRGIVAGNNGGPATTTALLLFSIIIISSLTRFQNLCGFDLVVYSSFFVTALGMLLMISLWFKCQEQDASNQVDHYSP